MKIFDKRSTLLLLCLTLPLIFLPKINLVQFSEESAGIRVDDMILFLFSGVMMWALLQRQNSLSSLEYLVLAITLFSIFSFSINRVLVFRDLLHTDAKIFYCIRIFEYFMFFYIGALCCHLFQLDSLLLCFLFWNFVLILMQKASWIGGITGAGYIPDINNRVQGIASFPSEMGYLLNLLYAYFAFNQSINQRIPIHRSIYVYIVFFVFLILTLWTGNRISLLALIFCFLFKLKNEWNSQSIQMRVLTIFLIISVMSVSAGIILYSEEIQNRSTNLMSFNNFKAFKTAWEKIDITRNPMGQEEGHGFTEHDASWWMRVHKWMFVIKVFIYHPECYLQGLGPGVAFSALDGGFLRIVVEYGILGTFLFFYFFFKIYHQNQQLKWIMIAFFINMITFDVYLAYKPMSLIFLISGYDFANKESLSRISHKLLTNSQNKSTDSMLLSETQVKEFYL